MMSTPMSPETPSESRGIALVDALNAVDQGDLSHRILISFSDLDREKVRLLEAAWSGIAEAQRARLIQALDELGETSLLHNFGRVFRVGLRDESSVVRQRSIAALWEDESSSLIDELLALLDDVSQDVRAEAAQALGRFATKCELGEIPEETGERIFGRLEALAIDARESHLVSRRALESLAVFVGHPEVPHLIAEAYEHDDQLIRAGALYAMGRTQDVRWLETLIGEFDNEDPEMRYEAARAAGEIGDTGAVEGLARLTGDPDVEVRRVAIDALTRIGSPGSARVLRRLAEHASGEERKAIEDALEEISAIDDD